MSKVSRYLKQAATIYEFSTGLQSDKTEAKIYKQQEMCHNVTNAPKDTIFLELRPEVKVTVTRRQYVTLCDPKVYPHSLPQIILEICSGHDFFRIEVRGQGHSDPKIVCNTPDGQFINGRLWGHKKECSSLSGLISEKNIFLFFMLCSLPA